MSSQQQASSVTSTATTTTNPSSFSHASTFAQIHGTVYSQSFSGSETDVSTSTENLSPEERYALEHTQRQEPQGQENVEYTGGGGSMANAQLSRVPAVVTSGSTIVSTARSNESNASISSSTNSTLIIHNTVADEPWTHRWTPGGYSTPMAGRKSTSSTLHDGQEGALPSYNSQVHKLRMESLNLNSSLLNSSLLNSSLLDSSVLSKPSVPSYLSQNSIPGSPKLSSRSSAMKYQASTDLPDIPSSYLDQSEVLKHLLKQEGKGSGQSDQSASSSNSGINLVPESAGTMAKNHSQANSNNDLDTTVNYDVLNLPPPPAYPSWRLDDIEKQEQPAELARHAVDKSFSKSQPDLTRLGNTKDATNTKELLGQRIVSGQTDYSDGHLQEVADILAQENSALKMEVDLYHRKVAKLQRFEMEIIKVHEAHEALVKLSERREHLERLARHKLHADVKRLTEMNSELKEQIDVLTAQIASRAVHSDSSDSLRKELNKRDVFIAQLVSQNKELIAAKERQEIELTAQRQTLNEQRTHIDILDSALTNAQANVVRLEEELRKKQNLVEQAGQLKRLLVTHQLSSDRREQSEKLLRQKLEKEIEQLRHGSKQEGPGCKLSDLRREIREKDEKIMMLESEVTKWEQRYHQETAMRQLAIDAASMPKDAKIAALEKTSQETDRRIAQAKSDKLRHMDEIHNMNKKQTEYEARNRELESHIAERDAMIKVLQKRAEEKEALYQNALRNSLVTGKSIDGRSNSSNSSMIHSTQVSSIHSHSSSGFGGAGGGGGGGSNISSTPVRDEELGCAPPIPPFPCLSTTSVSNTASSLSVCSENRASSRLSRFRDQVEERMRADSCGGASQSPATVTDVESIGSDDLLVDGEDESDGKLGVMCFPGLAHSSSAVGEGKVPQPLLACVEPRPSFVSACRRPTSDLSILGLSTGLDPLPLVHARPLSDLPGLTCPAYDPLPSYSLESSSTAPLPPPRDFSSLSTQQPQYLANENSSISPVQPRGDPPPYYGHHEVVTRQGSSEVQTPPLHPAEQSISSVLPSSPPLSPNSRIAPNMSPSTPNLATDMPLPRPPLCRNPHHPTVACRKCNSVRTSNRQNAAILVRRANSSAGQSNRNSSLLSACQTNIDTDDAPSILARLRREWELGNFPLSDSNLQNKCSSVDSQSPYSSDTAQKDVKPQSFATQQALKEPRKLKQQQPQQQQQLKSQTFVSQEMEKDQTVPKMGSPDTRKELLKIGQQKTGQTHTAVENTDPKQRKSKSTRPSEQSTFQPTHPHTNHKDSNNTHSSSRTEPHPSSRSESIMNGSTRTSDASTPTSITPLTLTNNSIVYPANNKDNTSNKDENAKNKDNSHLTKHQDHKIELIILEDTDQLKVSQDKDSLAKSLEGVI